MSQLQNLNLILRNDQTVSNKKCGAKEFLSYHLLRCPQNQRKWGDLQCKGNPEVLPHRAAREDGKGHCMPCRVWVGMTEKHGGKLLSVWQCLSTFLYVIIIGEHLFSIGIHLNCLTDRIRCPKLILKWLKKKKRAMEVIFISVPTSIKILEKLA